MTNLQIYNLLYQRQTSLVREPSASLGDSFKFTDALGRSNNLPYEVFRYWTVFESYLKCTFEGLPGEETIQSKHYHLLNAKAAERGLGPIISKHRWGKQVFTGANVAMSMIITTKIGSGQICQQTGCDGLGEDSTDVPCW